MRLPGSFVQHGRPLSMIEVAKVMQPADSTIFRASLARGFDDTSYVAAWQWGSAPEDDGRLIEEDEFEERYSRPGFQWHKRMTVTQAQIGSELSDQDKRYRLLTSGTQGDTSAWLAQVGGTLAPQFLDPLNYLPLAGLLGKATLFAKGMSKAKALGIEGGVIEGARQGIFYGRDTALHRDFDGKAAMMSVAMGVGIGSGFGLMLDAKIPFKAGVRHLGNAWDQVIVQGRKMARLGPETDFPQTPTATPREVGGVLDDLNMQGKADEAEAPELSPEAKERYDALRGLIPRAAALVKGCMTRIRGGS